MGKFFLIGFLLFVPKLVLGHHALKYALVATNTRYYQVIDTTGKILLDSVLRPEGNIYYSARYDEGIFKFERSGKLGYKNIHSKILLPAAYDEVSDFINGSGIVKKDGKTGVVNKEGAFVIPQVFNYLAHADANGLLIVIDSNGFLGLMNVNGETVLKPTYLPYQTTPVFSENLLPVRTKIISSTPTGTKTDGIGQIGFINRQGHLVIDTVWATDPGMWASAWEQTAYGRQYTGGSVPANDYYRFEGGRSLARKNNRNVAIDTKGKFLFTLPDSLENIYNSQGLFRFQNKTSGQSNHSKRGFGFFNETGIVFKSAYPPEGDFRDGYMLIKLNDTTYQFYNTAGNPAFNKKTFRLAFSFSDGYAQVFFSGQVRSGLLDRNGGLKSLDNTIFASHTQSSNGWFTIIKSSGWGFVDAHNKEMIPPAYSVLYRFWNGYCGFRNADGKGGYINERNEVVIPATYYDVLDFQVLKD